MSEAQATPRTGLLFTDEILRDPYPTYRRFLEDDQVFHSVPDGGGGWAVFRHAACSSLIRDSRLSARRVGAIFLALPPERRAEFDELARMLSLWLLFFDAPEHSRLRKLMNKGFSPTAAEGLRPQIAAIVERMLDTIRRASDADVVREIAYPLPVRVMAEMFGVREAVQERFIRWTTAVTMFLGNPNRTVEQTQSAQEGVLALKEFFRGAVAERRRQRGSDLLSLLLDIEEDGEVLTEEELYAQCVLLLGAGHDTTRNLISNGMYALLQNPEQMAELRKSPELIRSAVEELLRYESPIQFVGRVAKEEMDIYGVRVHKGQLVRFMLGAANRDSQQFRDPDNLDLKRSPNPHLAFGAGEHFCIGNQLARLEGQIAISKMVQQFPRMRLATPSPEWAPNFGFRSLKALPVVV